MDITLADHQNRQGDKTRGQSQLGLGSIPCTSEWEKEPPETLRNQTLYTIERCHQDAGSPRHDLSTWGVYLPNSLPHWKEWIMGTSSNHAPACQRCTQANTHYLQIVQIGWMAQQTVWCAFVITSYSKL